MTALFKHVSKYGIQGHNEGGIFDNSTLQNCAKRCIADKQCASFELERNRCFISYTDRWHVTERFLRSYPFGSYYEWKGLVIPFHVSHANNNLNIFVKPC